MNQWDQEEREVARVEVIMDMHHQLDLRVGLETIHKLHPRPIAIYAIPGERVDMQPMVSNLN